MKNMSTWCLLAVLATLGVVVYHITSSEELTAVEVRAIVNEELDKREQRLIDKYRGRLQEVEKDFGLTPSNPQTIEEFIDSIIQFTR